MSGVQQLADGARYTEVPDQLDTAIADEDASTIIRLRGPGGSARMSDMGCIFDKLGVEVVSCSTTTSARSCDMTLVVVDRHDSQPLHDCQKQSIVEGLNTVVPNGSGPKHVGNAACTSSSDTGDTEQQAASRSPPQRNSSTDSRSELLGVGSAAVAGHEGIACSRQPSFAESLHDKQLLHTLEQHQAEHLPQQQHGSSNADDRGGAMSLESRGSSIRFALPLIPVAEEIASPAVVTGNSLRPQLTIDIPSAADTGLLSNGSFFISGSTIPSSQPSYQVTPTAFAGFDIVRRPADPSLNGRYAAPGRQQQQQTQQRKQQQQQLAAQELTERLMQLGMGRSPSKQLADDSSSEDEAHVGSSSAASSRRPSSRWLGPLSRQQSSGVADLMDPGASSNGGKGHRRTSISGNDSNAWCSTSAAVQQAATAAALAAAWQPEHGASPDNNPSAGAPLSPFVTEKARAAALLSPCISKPPASTRRRPPRTPSRIILSPVAADGSVDLKQQPKLFVSIPKQPMDEKRARKQVGKTPHSRQLVAATPRQMLQQLAVHDSTDRFSCASTSPTAVEAAAAADAASKMPFNVAAAAAQLLGKNRDAAAAAIATAVAGDTSPLLRSPAQTAPSSAANSADLLPSPPSATPRGMPLTPATPVHPVVAAIAAVAFKAAAEAVGEAAAAEAAAATIDEGEEGYSAVSSADDSAGASADDESPEGSSSEEWWCGSLTGMVVRDVMTGNIKVVHQDTDVVAARQLMVQHNLPGMLVDTGTDTPGFLTRRDFFKGSITRRAHKRKQPKLCVKDIMSHPVIAVDASQPIELCAQMMQEQGIRRAAVKDADAPDCANPMSAYVGLVSDTTIFRCLGLYPDEGTELDEDQGSIGMPATARLGANANSSAGGSAFDTPFSSRAPTPLVPAKGSARSDVGQQGCAGQQPQQRYSTACDKNAAAANIFHTAETSSRKPAADLLSAGSTGSAAAADALDRSSSSSSAADAKASEQVVAGDSIGSTATGPDSGSMDSAPPDALLRYKTAASLWEVDVDEMEMIKKIGEGSFGEVMVANYRGTKVAVKRLHVLDMDDVPHASMYNGQEPARGGSQAAFRQFFEREIAILASIRHPNVVNFIGACHKTGQRCLVTEYCARGSLDTVLHKSGGWRRRSSKFAAAAYWGCCTVQTAGTCRAGSFVTMACTG
eukprot:GHUV01017112.1.p1 GENE.GHUV01017112.1~~GHUV01017112.1.p1  ORF type:complete len:1179 (+),score=479.98 GHUV01017112.1:302-3838(+)